MLYSRKDFEIMPYSHKGYPSGNPHRNVFCIRTEDRHYLHSNGRIYLGCVEDWPSQIHAEEILDKWFPKPMHVWEHGDVFTRKGGVVLVYLVVDAGSIVYSVYSPSHLHKNYHPVNAAPDPKVCLADATFLFNIKDKL